MVIVKYIHYSVSSPSILFRGLVLFAPLIAYSHLVPQGCSYLVSCFGEISGCAVMVKSAGPPMIPKVALQFSFLCIIVKYWSLCGWCL